MRLLVVNYHYISDRENEYPHGGIFPITVKKLTQQMEELSKIFTFISQDDIIDAIKSGGLLPGNSCLITFDDGLSCQYNKALPILEKMGIPAIFFVTGYPYDKDHDGVLLAHKIHWCQACIPPDDFLRAISINYKKCTGEDFIVDKFDIPEELIKKQYNFGDLATSKFKFALNHYMEETLKVKIIDPIFSALVNDNLKEFADGFYLSATEISNLHKKNYLGIHGYSHNSFAYMNADEIERDISKCLKIFKDIVGEDTPNISSISYPRGGLPAGDCLAKLVEVLNRRNIKIGFTTSKQINVDFSNPLMISRFDANYAPHGKSEIIKIIDNDFYINV